MKCHDGIIIVLLLFLCFELPQQHRIRELYALQRQKILLNNQLDLAIQEAAEKSFVINDGKIVWKPEEAAWHFFEAVGKDLRLSREDFPVFLVRERDVLHVLENGRWQEVSLTGSKAEKTDAIRKTMENALAKSIVSQKEGLIPHVSIPYSGVRERYNDIGSYSMLAVFQAGSRYASLGGNIYIVSGAAVSGLGM